MINITLTDNFFKNLKQKDYIFIILSAVFIFFLITISLLMILNDHSLNNFIANNDNYIMQKNVKGILNGETDDLYDVKWIEQLKLGEQHYFPLYPPVFYLINIPYSFLSLFWVKFLTIVISVLLYITALVMLLLTFRRLHCYRFLILLTAFFFPPFIYIILNGTFSIYWLFILTLSFFLSKKDKLFLAGFTLSFLIFKPSFFLIVFTILIFSFRPKLIGGFLSGILLLFLVSGFSLGFQLWNKWFFSLLSLSDSFLNKNSLLLIRDAAFKQFFYPITATDQFLFNFEYLWMIIGLFAIMTPIIYSFFRKNSFSRNSFWLLLSIALVLANPYIYKYDIVILLLPIMIFNNLMFADKVSKESVFIVSLIFNLSLILFFMIDNILYVLIYIIALWFILINGMLGKRIRNYQPKIFIEYWHDY